MFDDADFHWRRSGPTPRTIRAFGIREDALRPFPGGAGYNWTDGRLVLKPVGYVPEHDWVCEVYAAWDSQGVRVPEPVAPQGGTDRICWSAEGWGAHVFVTGRDTDLVHELARVKDASDAFHDNIKDLPRPDFLDVRNDPWAFGDRVAWDAAKPEGDPKTLEVICALSDHLAPVTTTGQPTGKGVSGPRPSRRPTNHHRGLSASRSGRPAIRRMYSPGRTWSRWLSCDPRDTTRGGLGAWRTLGSDPCSRDNLDAHRKSPWVHLVWTGSALLPANVKPRSRHPLIVRSGRVEHRSPVPGWASWASEVDLTGATREGCPDSGVAG